MPGIALSEVIVLVVILFVRLSIILLGVFALLRVFAPERLHQWRAILSRRIGQYHSYNGKQKS